MSTRKRASPETLAFLCGEVEAAVAPLAGVERRRMFASDAWFVRGSLFAIVSTTGRVIVRVPDAATQAELLALDGAAPWQLGNKAPMRGWLVLPERMHDDRDDLRAWLRRAWQQAPTKSERPARAATKRAAPKKVPPTARKRGAKRPVAKKHVAKKHVAKKRVAKKHVAKKKATRPTTAAKAHTPRRR